MDLGFEHEHRIQFLMTLLDGKQSHGISEKVGLLIEKSRLGIDGQAGIGKGLVGEISGIAMDPVVADSHRIGIEILGLMAYRILHGKTSRPKRASWPVRTRWLK